MAFLNRALKWFAFLATPMTVGVIVTGLMTWLAVQLYASERSTTEVDEGSILGIFDEIYRKTIDFRFLNRGEQSGSPRVAILAIDDASIEREGRWPWPREKIGRLIENAVDAGAKVVAFDMVFSEADPNSTVPTLMKLKWNIAKLANGQPISNELVALLNKEIESGNSDKKLADTVGLYKDAVVMGTYYDAEKTNFGSNSLRSYCVDSDFNRTREKKYWEKEETIPIVIDPTYETSPDALSPTAILEPVATHITGLENEHAVEWFNAHPQAVQAVKEKLHENEIEIPQDQIPNFFVWANIDDLYAAKEALSQMPELAVYANENQIKLIFADVLRALTQQQKADLRRSIAIGVEAYCQRFLTKKDELLDRKKFFEGRDIPEAQQQELWPEYGLEPIWERYLIEKKLPQTPLATMIEHWRAEALVNPIESFGRTWISIPALASVTSHTGYFNATLDPDGSIRHARLIARRGHLYIPSLSLKAFLVDRKLRARITLDAATNKERRQSVSKFEFIDDHDQVRLVAPVDNQGRIMINYSGPQQMFDHISASSLLESGERLTVSRHTRDKSSLESLIKTSQVNRKDFLKDKILVVGATAIGVYDLRQTPFEENYPGVETHANVISNLLTEEARARGEKVPAEQPGFLRVHPLEEKAMWIVLLAGGIALSAALTYLDAVSGLVVTLFILVGLYVLDRYVLFAHGYVINISLPFITTFSIFVGITSYKYFTEERNKRALKGTFAKYVSPAVVEEILKDPSNIELGGKKMELTVMFSDVRGFTTISEKLDPRSLSNLLNSYLTPMTDLVFQTKGTLDKYMGDAIMAFWGAPIQFEDHADRAATCALLMLKKLKELQAEYVAKGLPTIDVGIGLNTGDMSVGNMGSNTVRSYTVMGDSVNLGSRLEGINKEYGTRIIVSEFTQRRIASSFVTREVDWVRVKGKAQPVRIFELIGTKSGAPGTVAASVAAPADMLAVLPDFETGFHLYHERRFEEAIVAFTRALNMKPDDQCSQLYIERCQDYLKEPPVTDWDGVYTMKTK